MRKKEMTKRGFLFACSVLITVSGCRFRREVSVTLPSGMNEQKETQQSGDVELSMNSDENLNKDNGSDSNSEPIYLESVKLKRNDNTDLNQFAQLLLGVSTIEEAEQYKPKHSLGDYYYEKDGTVAIYNKDFLISYGDDNDGMESSYSRLMSPFEYRALLRGMYPEEELDFCTKEQAIKVCEKYAKLCGYEDAEVSSYAITLDAIEKINKIFQVGAPGEGYEVVTRGQVELLRDEGKDDEADALRDKIDSGAERNLPWKKEYEAMLLVYHLKLNDILVDSTYQVLEIVYVPQKDKIAILSAGIPYEPEEISEKRELISKEKAMSQAVQVVGTNMKINAVSLVYAIEYDQDGNENAVPAWRIDYTTNETDVTNLRAIYIDAVSGFEVN